MSRIAALILAIALLTWLPCLHVFAGDREKVEEGRYALLNGKGEVSKKGHSWTLWRLAAGGYELEDHLEPEPGAIVPPLTTYENNAVANARGFLRESVVPSEFHAIYSADWQLLSLTVSGKDADHQRRDALKCRSDAKRIECNGADANATLTLDGSRELFWWYRIPMLLRPWLLSTPGNTTAPRAAKVAMLSFATPPGVELKTHSPTWSNRPHLDPADLTVASVGEAVLVLGDRTLLAQKYELNFHPKKGDPLSLIAWTDGKGAILAVADARMPEILVELVEYKRYPDDAASAPAQPER